MASSTSPLTSPEIVIWEITRRCNFSCTHCIVSADPHGGGQAELDTEEAVQVLHQLADLGVRSVFFSGGEPFLRRDLPELLRRGNQIAPFTFSAVSNGSVLTSEVLRRVKDLGLKTLQISLDGATSEQFSQLRKGPPRAFDQALAAIRLCHEVGLPVSVGMFLHPGNIASIPQVVELVARHGVSVLRFSGFVPLGRGASPEIQESMRYDFDQMVDFFRFVAAHDPVATGVTLAFDHAFGPTDDCFHCTAGERSFYLTSGGDVYPCPSFLHPDYRIGNVREASLASLWQNPRMRDFRIPPEEIRGHCARCPDLAACRGGCRGVTYAYTQDVRESFPNCLRRYRRYLAEQAPDLVPAPQSAPRPGRGGLLEVLGSCYEQHAQDLDRALQAHPLSYLLWQSTLRCNLRCGHCAVPAEGWDAAREMDTRQVKSMLDRFARDFDVSRIGALAISGGEPTLRADLPEIVAHASALGFRVGLDSNGLSLGRRTELIDRLVGSGLALPCLSFDGLEATHDANRGVACHEWVVKALDYFARKHPRLPLQTVTVVTRRNLPELPRILEALESLGVGLARFATVVPMGRAPQDPENFLQPEELRRMLRWIARQRAAAAEGRRRIVAEFSCDGWCGRALHAEGLEGLVRENIYNCPAGVTMATVYYDGRMGACLSMPDELSVQGNVLEEDPGVIWERGYRRYRDRTMYRRDACAACAEWRYCQGGAMHNRGPQGELLNCTWRTLQEAAPDELE